MNISRIIISYCLWIFLCVGGGAAVGIFTAGGVSDWYQTLNKPAWTPPDWVFAPVWTVLYIMMGVAACLIWRNGGWRKQSKALGLFIIQLLLNYIWSFIFFTAQRLDWALAEIIILLVSIVITIWQFAKIDRRASLLLIPYCLWVMFATALTAAILFIQ